MALNILVKVHPVVLFQIVDAYERRNADAHRVIGTLLGSVEKGVVEVTNCFCVPHKEYEDQVEAELNYAMDLYDLNKRVNIQEAIVGWWATGNEVTSHSSVIHEYYARECSNPIHLTLDTTLQGARMGIKAYLKWCAMNLKSLVKTMGLSKKTVEPMMDLAQVAEASEKLTGLLDSVLLYVEEVLAGRTQPDNAVGRALLGMINSVPKMTPEEFENMFNSNVKDLLMVITLSQLTKTQLQLNENQYSP
uniref:MPN domain-containing protein n=1 Tax=Timema tahoe TaxID=61484 RepID=A0A7R9NXB4_9NEOP|nr:unnamed protein product [Timema tahoe]